MSYRSEIAELTRYFRTVNVFNARLEDPSIKNNQNVRKVKKAIDDMLKKHEVKERGSFTPQKPETLLEILRRTHYFEYSPEEVYTYSLHKFELAPQQQYMYDYDTYGEKLIFYIIPAGFNPNSMYSYLQPAYIYLLPCPYNSLVSMMNSAMNYKIVKLIISPESVRNLEMRMKLLFGDIK